MAGGEIIIGEASVALIQLITEWIAAGRLTEEEAVKALEQTLAKVKASQPENLPDT